MAHDVVIVQSGACALSMKANREFALTSSVEQRVFELQVRLRFLTPGKLANRPLYCDEKLDF
jgi:hypothetical protein